MTPAKYENPPLFFKGGGIFPRTLEPSNPIFVLTLPQSHLQNLQSKFDIGSVKAHGGLDPEDIPPQSSTADQHPEVLSPLHDPGAFFRGGFLGFPVFDQFDAEHQAQPPYISNLLVPGHQSLQAVHKNLSHFQGILLQVFPVDNFQDRPAHGTGNRVAAEGVEVMPLGE